MGARRLLPGDGEEGEAGAPQEGYVGGGRAPASCLEAQGRYLCVLRGQCWCDCQRPWRDEGVGNYGPGCEGMRRFVPEDRVCRAVDHLNLDRRFSDSLSACTAARAAGLFSE